MKSPFEYSFWYEIAHYANENWKGNFSERELASFSYDYLESFKDSYKNKNPDKIVGTLVENLYDDMMNGNEEVLDYLEPIAENTAWEDFFEELAMKDIPEIDESEPVIHIDINIYL